jgi:hypothetical protein
METNLPRFRAPLVRDIRRTHHELVKLQDHLIYANPECFVPALPPPVTSAGAGTEEDEKRMKLELQRWFDVISSNPVLIRDEEIMLFVESDFGVHFTLPHSFVDPSFSVLSRPRSRSTYRWPQAKSQETIRSAA